MSPHAPLYAIDTFGQLEPFIHQEWLLTNGLGGFASATVVGCNTRRYHGLLMAATIPPVGRVSALSRIGEMLILDGDDQHPHELAVNRFRASVHPRGEQYLRTFELGDTARWNFDVAGVKVTKEVLVPWMKNLVGVRYTLDAGSPDRQVEFRAWPFFGLRDFHALRRAAGYDMATTIDGKSISVSAENLTASVSVVGDGASFVKDPGWWYGHVYAIETERGQDDMEDLFTPGRFSVTFKGKTSLTFWATVGSAQTADWDAELAARRKALAASRPAATAPSTTLTKLTRAANDFVVARKTPDGKPGTSIIAGYPWFADWGRDTMISLPGLLLTTRRFDRAKEVLSVFASYVSQGMIPNRFDDYTNEPHYNTVDASLWFVHACHEYLRTSEDRATFDKVLRPACAAIIDGYRRGTRFKIRMDEADGLIDQGDEHTQLTWMDAKCGDVTFTPRQGKPVEINALWHRALTLMGETALADKVRDSFRKAFWISPFRGLADVVTRKPDGSYQRDNSIRPNQIFAVSLSDTLLTREQQAAVVEVVRRELLTPVGLRTLAKSDPRYVAKYTGAQFDRDRAYHNGAIWPWLIGAFLDGHLRVHDRSPDAIAQAQRWLALLIDHLDDACLGQISEIFEADEPHRAVGCCAQAWSVAEVLRLAVTLGM